MNETPQVAATDVSPSVLASQPTGIDHVPGAAPPAEGLAPPTLAAAEPPGHAPSATAAAPPPAAAMPAAASEPRQDPEPVHPAASAAAPTTRPSTARSAALPDKRVTFYVTADERARLAMFRARDQIAETVVMELALERLFELTDDEIAAILRARGHRLRRTRTNG